MLPDFPRKLYRNLKKEKKTLFEEICLGIKVEDQKKFGNFRVANGRNCSSSPVEQKMIEMQRLSENVSKLDAHYGLYLLKNCFSLPKLLYFLRTNPCFEEWDLLQQYDSIIRKSLFKICNVNFNESSYTQAILY